MYQQYIFVLTAMEKKNKNKTKQKKLHQRNFGDRELYRKTYKNL